MMFNAKKEPDTEKDAVAVEEYHEDLPEHVPLTVWIILIISSLGVFMASVSTTALVIAFPVVLIDLNMTISTMMWVLLVLLLMLGAVVPAAGKLGDMFGQSRVYLIGYYSFVIGSLGGGFCTQNNRGYDLIACRVIIGFGAALLFTNSSAILTNAFAPYGKVGLSQGVFMLFSALGIVLGPLIGGGFAETNWRWIFWYNAPIGGALALLATFLLKDTKSNDKTLSEQLRTFDFLGAVSCATGLVLILIALVQAVVADPVLSQPGAIAGLVLGGVLCGAVFITDQFFADDPLIPPIIFYNRIFSLTTFGGAMMGFVRSSITYNMIFFLQGPKGKNPLDAGIALIPFGIGIMVAGISAGILNDKIGGRYLIGMGPLITMAGLVCLCVMTQYTTDAYIGGILFLTGCGIGLFQSPNGASQMLAVKPNQRGTAAAVNMLTLSFGMMLGIVLTFAFILHSLTSDQLFEVFIYGSSNNSTFPYDAVLQALAYDYYVIIACSVLAAGTAIFLPTDMKSILEQSNSTVAQINESNALRKEKNKNLGISLQKEESKEAEMI